MDILFHMECSISFIAEKLRSERFSKLPSIINFVNGRTGFKIEPVIMDTTLLTQNNVECIEHMAVP